LLKQNDGICGEIKMFLEIAKESMGIPLVNEDHLVCTVLRNVLIKGVIKFNFNKSKTTLWRFL
jgi:DNA-directed RNA polymerase subunit L